MVAILSHWRGTYSSARRSDQDRAGVMLSEFFQPIHRRETLHFITVNCSAGEVLNRERTDYECEHHVFADLSKHSRAQDLQAAATASIRVHCAAPPGRRRSGRVSGGNLRGTFLGGAADGVLATYVSRHQRSFVKSLITSG